MNVANWRDDRRVGMAVVVRLLAIVASLLLFSTAYAQPSTTTKADTFTSQSKAAANFPPELVKWAPRTDNPIFTAEGPGHWDVKIRERGWILKSGDDWQLWFTGYDGTREGTKMLGYATSRDGIHWERSPQNPIFRDRWVEDMCVVRQGDTYYMFAEGEGDNHAEMLTSSDGVDWKWIGKLDVRSAADKTKPTRRPCGTPTVWIEGDTWYLMYEWMDKGVWLATTTDPMSLVWQDVREEPALSPGPDAYDKEFIAVNQVFKYKEIYYAIYHGSGTGEAFPRTWTTNIARSTDRVHWQKYLANPIVSGDKSSGVVVSTQKGFRLYTMHGQIDVYESL